MSDVKTRVAEVARELFLSQGYNQTTIKQIVAASGVQTGSIYHFYKNKEEIFEYTAISSFDLYRGLVADYYKDAEISNAYSYSAVTFITFYLAEYYSNFLDVIYEMYRSSTITHHIAEHAARYNLEWFGEFNPGCDYDYFYPRTLAMEGCIYSFVANKYPGSPIPFRTRIKTFFSIALSTYNAPKDVIDEITSDACIDKLEADIGEIVRGIGTTKMEL